MLNENIYARLQEKKAESNALTSERERIRNKFIDTFGRKPTEEEIDALLIKQSFG
jgi:hypothetical protein